MDISSLISDSGVIKYRIVTEEWIVNPNLNPSRYIFDKGVLLTQFDEKFNVFSYIQCDTAYYYDKKKLWELRSRVKILTKSGIKFSSEELFWDENNHELYSNKFSRLVTPERSLQGRYFRSDEQLRRYFITNSKGSFLKSDMFKEDTTTQKASTDTSAVVPPKRGMTMPRKKNNN